MTVQHKGQNENVEAGDLAYYKRNSDERWKGPANVIGKQGKTLIRKHKGYVIKVQETRIRSLRITAETVQSQKECIIGEPAECSDAEKLIGPKANEASNWSIPQLDDAHLLSDENQIRKDTASSKNDDVRIFDGSVPPNRMIWFRLKRVMRGIPEKF